MKLWLLDNVKSLHYCVDCEQSLSCCSGEFAWAVSVLLFRMLLCFRVIGRWSSCLRDLKWTRSRSFSISSVGSACQEVILDCDLPADEVFGGLVWAAGCEKWDFDPAFFLQVQ